MKTVCDVLGVERSNVVVRVSRPADWVDARTDRTPDDAALVADIGQAVADPQATVIDEPGACCDAPLKLLARHRSVKSGCTG